VTLVDLVGLEIFPCFQEAELRGNSKSKCPGWKEIQDLQG
jgi:hypothetical protein